MKVGDYVRTKDGLNKIIEMDSIPGSDGKHSFYMVELDNQERIYEDEIIKSSPNIIDLIEVGDFVTYKNSNFYFNIPTRVCGLFDELTLSIVKMVGNNFLNEVEITSIVTKEQFKNIEYKVGDKE